MQELIARRIECAEDGKVRYEIQWFIPNWRQVRRDKSLVRNQLAVFETGLEPKQMIQTKWLVGLRVVPVQDDVERARVYWQLLDIKGSGSQEKLKVRLVTTLFSADGIPRYNDAQIGHLSVLEMIEEENEYLDVETPTNRDDDVIYSNGSVQYKLILTYTLPKVDSSHLKKLKLEQFSKLSHDQLRGNLAVLLNEDSNGDLKIIASDGVELRAYRSILKVQCPVFAGMLNSDLSETQTGIVKVEDISGKTMKILLHYFYTGDLPNGWDDHETIVEFTYAAGKYQMTQVLNLLDDLLGTNDQDQVSNLDVQLLNLTWKLAMKNSEARLMQRIVGKVTSATSSEDLFQLFGYDSEEVTRKADIMAAESVQTSKVLEVLEYMHGNTGELMAFPQRGLTFLALVQRNGSLKSLEEILLKKLAEITSKFTTAEELFALFGDEN